MHTQGCKSKALATHRITIESEKMDAKLMEMKFWNRTMQSIFPLKTDSKVKLGTLHVNNMKNLEHRCEVLEKNNMMEKFTIQNQRVT